jgi:hypothetical protein
VDIALAGARPIKKTLFSHFDCTRQLKRDGVMQRLMASKFISGLPSTGKTSFRNYMRSRGVTVVSLAKENDDDLSMAEVGLKDAWGEFLHKGDPAFTEIVLANNYVIEWGFPPHPEMLKVVRRIHESGITAWWIDGHYATLRNNHEAAGKNLEAFDKQLAKVVKYWPQMREIYVDRIICRVASDGGYMAPEEVWTLIFGADQS